LPVLLPVLLPALLPVPAEPKLPKPDTGVAETESELW
jgi:hypothetical protein